MLLVANATRPPADHLKLVFPLCWSMVQIAWSMHSGEAVLKKGTFDKQTNWQWSLQTLLHGLDFLFKCHLKPDSFVAQVRTLPVSSCCMCSVCLFWQQLGVPKHTLGSHQRCTLGVHQLDKNTLASTNSPVCFSAGAWRGHLFS